MPDVALAPLPFEQAKQFWADKTQMSPAEFNRLRGEAKARAFAVSGIAKGDELSTVYNALQKSVDTGTSFSDFKRDCAPIFERRGWTGKRAWRVDNIFRTNIQTAYNVGRYQQMMEVVDTFPYWRYDGINDARTRPTHLAMHGRVFRADSPVWDTWYPPNGFRCRCSVTPLTEGQVKRRGLKVETWDPSGETVFPIDPQTGMRSPVPVQLLPDPGFAYNPGKAYWEEMGSTLAAKAQEWPLPIAAQVLPEQASGGGFSSWYAAPVGNWPLARLTDEHATMIGAQVARVALLSAKTALQQAISYPEITAAEYALIQNAVDLGLVIQDGARSLIYVLQEENGYVTVVKSTRSGDKIYVSSFRRLSSTEAKRDSEVARLMSGGEFAPRRF